MRFDLTPYLASLAVGLCLATMTGSVTLDRVLATDVARDAGWSRSDIVRMAADSLGLAGAFDLLAGFEPEPELTHSTVALTHLHLVAETK